MADDAVESPAAPIVFHETIAAPVRWKEDDSPQNQTTVSGKRFNVSSEQANAWRLRWRRPNIAPTTGQSVTQLPLAVSKAVLQWDDSPPSHASRVRQVAQFAPVDPFDDPFGDKQGTARRGSVRHGTTDISQPAQVLNTQDLPTTPTPNDTAPMPGNAPSPENTQPKEAAPTPSVELPLPKDGLQRDAEQPRPDVLPANPDTPQTTDAPKVMPTNPDSSPTTGDTSGQLKDKKPCDRIYNERNCCSEDEQCQKARNNVRQDKITNISLDITPSYPNTETEKISTEVLMARELANAPARTWKDREGQQLAEGRLVDYRQGRIHVLTASGDTVKIPFANLSDDDLCFVSAWWWLPTECPLDDEQFAGRDWLAANLNWKASALCHKPLYFEEVALERYGHTAGPLKQPFISAAHFFGSLVTLPYQMGINPPQECQYALGYYRPGSCAPWLVPPVPISVRGGLAEAGVWLGGIYIIP